MRYKPSYTHDHNFFAYGIHFENVYFERDLKVSIKVSQILGLFFLLYLLHMTNIKSVLLLRFFL